jgi:hypothetical protein
MLTVTNVIIISFCLSPHLLLHIFSSWLSSFLFGTCFTTSLVSLLTQEVVGSTSCCKDYGILIECVFQSKGNFEQRKLLFEDQRLLLSRATHQYLGTCEKFRKQKEDIYP